MTANLETGAFANKAAWHNEGNVLDTDGKLGMGVADAIEASGLNWDVVKTPAFTFRPEDLDQNNVPKPDATPIRVDSRFATMRTSDFNTFGTVGKAWHPVQNVEGFALVEDLLQGADCWIEAAGALDGGKKVWVLAHMADNMRIAGEDYSKYILFTNGHDGRSSVTAAMTDVRVVCQNTLALALSDAPRIVRVRHTSRASERVQEVKHLLGIRDLYAEELAKQGEWLVEQELTDSKFDQFLRELMPADENLPHVVTMAETRRETIANLYHQAENLGPIRGTRWGALQATIEYADHHRNFVDNDAAIKGQFGFTAGQTAVKNRAAQILRNPKLAYIA